MQEENEEGKIDLIRANRGRELIDTKFSF